MLTLATLDALLSPRGQEALALAASLPGIDTTLLRDTETLRASYGPELGAAALETLRLRRRARAKFSRADSMFWTREALEQASGEAVARHRAARFAGLDTVWDVCCSAGGDTIGLLSAGLRVTGLDFDPLRLRMAQLNCEAYGVAGAARWERADAVAWQPPTGAAVFFDPARRRNRGGSSSRVFRPDAYQPPLSLIDAWLSSVEALAVKIAPGADYEALPYDCEVELISAGGEVKEACLWFGRLRRYHRSATVLLPDAAHSLHGGSIVAPPPVEPLGWLYEPDGAVIRAHLVADLARQLGASLIDSRIAYLTADRLITTPFARAWRIVETMPFNLKRLRSRLHELDVGRVVVKKRGSPIDPQELERRLRLDGQRELTVFVTRVLGKPSVILAQSDGESGGEAMGSGRGVDDKVRR